MQPEQLIRTNSEWEHQAAAFCWCANNKNVYPELEHWFAIKNEEKSGSVIVGNKFKASGVKSGVHDTFLPLPKFGYFGLFIEIKKPGGKASDEQIKFGNYVQSVGYAWAVCDHWEKAVKVLIDYLSGNFVQLVYQGVKHRK